MHPLAVNSPVLIMPIIRPVCAVPFTDALIVRFVIEVGFIVYPMKPLN